MVYLFLTISRPNINEEEQQLMDVDRIGRLHIFYEHSTIQETIY